MSIDIGTPVRRSALLLHAMPASDREWIMARLPQAQQESLRDLLRELADLGIPADPRLLELICEQGPPPGDALVAPNAASEASFAQLCAAVRASDVVGIAAVLQHEPPQLIAAFLQVTEWPWHETLVEQLGPLKRKQLLALLAPRLGAPAAFDAVLPAHRLLLASVLRRAGISQHAGQLMAIAGSRLPQRRHDFAGRARNWLGSVLGQRRRRGMP